MKSPKAAGCGSHKMESGQTTVNISCSEDLSSEDHVQQELISLSVTPLVGLLQRLRLQELIPSSLTLQAASDQLDYYIITTNFDQELTHSQKIRPKKVSGWTRISWASESLINDT